MIEAGPGSTLDHLTAGLKANGLTPRDITHVLLTHIHLDHAGAAGWFADRGAQILVHPVGTPHLVNPEKLVASAGRVYGDQMDRLWGQFHPVREANLTEVRDGAEIAIGELRITGLHTPGHAEHHVAYIYEDTCFSGDVGGIRLPGPFYLRLPYVVPETHLGKWRASLEKLQQAGFKRIVPTHFGSYDDAAAHLDLARRSLDAVEAWLEAVMPSDPSVDVLERLFAAWLQEQGRMLGLDGTTLDRYISHNPPRMAVEGLQRYWRKVRLGEINSDYFHVTTSQFALDVIADEFDT